MKNFRRIIGVVVILAIVYSPALAITKSSLIASYKGQSIPTPTVTPQIPSWLPEWWIPENANVNLPAKNDSTVVITFGSDTPINCISCENCTPPTGAVIGFMPSPTPAPTQLFSYESGQWNMSKLFQEQVVQPYPIINCAPCCDANSSSIKGAIKEGPLRTPSPTPTPDIPQKGSVPVSFKTPPGSIYILSEPSGADVYLDGILQGTTPIMISGVSMGSHKLALTKSGYTGVRYTILGSTSKSDYTNPNDGFYSNGLSITVEPVKTVRILATLSLDIPSC